MSVAVRRALALVIFGSLAAATIAAALCYAFGRKLEVELRERTRHNTGPTGLEIVQLDHHAGVFESHGGADVRVATGCGMEAKRNPTAFHVDYRIQHAPRWGWLMRVELDARPLFVFGHDVRAQVGAGPIVSGSAIVGYDGTTHAQFHAPAFARHSPQGEFRTEAASASLRVGPRDLAFAWSLPGLSIGTADGRASLSGLRLQWKLSDRRRALGKTWLTVREVRIGATHVEHVSLHTVGSESAGLLALTLAAHIDKLQPAGAAPVSDAQTTLHLTGVHAASFETITTLMNDQCGAWALVGAKSTHWQTATAQLMRSGFSLAVDQCSARASDGGLAGKLTLELLPHDDAAADGVGLLHNLRAMAELDVAGPALAGQIHASPAWDRYFEERPDGRLGASFAFQRDNVQVNGRTWNPTLVKLGLDLLQSLLAGAQAP